MRIAPSSRCYNKEGISKEERNQEANRLYGSVQTGRPVVDANITWCAFAISDHTKECYINGTNQSGGIGGRNFCGEGVARVDKEADSVDQLGEWLKYVEYQARVMLEAMQHVLKETDVQILWKIDKLEPFNDNFLEAAMRDSAGRLRIEKWLDVEPPTLLQDGHILAFVHHGGAGSYHDSIE